MQNYKIIVQYDGTKYNGWQKQGNTDNTIQAKLEAVLTRLDGQAVEVNGSGRTDAGVHARGQCASFKLSKSTDAHRVMEYINEYLPRDIAVVSVEAVEDRFHARLNAKGKKYIYTISYGVYENVFERRYHWRLKEELDIEKMKLASEYFIGEHNFKAFCSNKRFKKSAVRRIYSIDFENDKKNGELRIIFCGNGFLYNMVRIMTGTLVEVGQGKRKPEETEKLLKSEIRSLSGVTAPACGLCLEEVFY